MSPEQEHLLRERYPDLIDADTELNFGDGWASIIDGMLEKIRGVVGDGRLKIKRLYTEDGSIRCDLRGSQLPTHLVSRARGQVLRARWHTHRTPQG